MIMLGMQGNIIKKSITLGKMKLFIGIQILVQQKQNHHPKVNEEE